MSVILETILLVAITKAANIIIDIGLKKSKYTQNSVDDYIFSTLDGLKELTKFIKLKK